ncbi:hypothetical protein E4U38_000299 [Claviceps purpurea]|nr:hypothetical protein E4U38_000299 [Claviceps purpurea]
MRCASIGRWTNDQVNAYNREHLEKIQKPIINIACDSTGRESNKAASRDAGNLQQQLSLAILGSLAIYGFQVHAIPTDLDSQAIQPIEASSPNLNGLEARDTFCCVGFV